MSLSELTINGFTDIVASSAPSPGGGSVAALAGSLAAALAGMVAALTEGKEKYAAYQDEMSSVLKESHVLQCQLTELIDRDSSSFALYMQALSLPKGTPAEKAIRSERMQDGLKTAALVPMETAEASFKVFPLAETVLQHGNSNAVTDALVSVLLARAAVLGALLNVRINLSSIRDEEFTQTLRDRADVLEKEANDYERRLMEKRP